MSTNYNEIIEFISKKLNSQSLNEQKKMGDWIVIYDMDFDTPREDIFSFKKISTQVELYFKFKFDKNSIQFINFHRLSKKPKSGNATQALEELIENIFIPITKQFKFSEFYVLFEIKFLPDTNPQESMSWFEKMGYMKTENINPIIYLKKYFV
ncbi:MAG: hypothetical protein LAT82_05365 [Nanoarchaeota archaeon]|nr:hypothetical protein [Nanoarchaeota archaeon]